MYIYAKAHAILKIDVSIRSHRKKKLFSELFSFLLLLYVCTKLTTE